MLFPAAAENPLKSRADLQRLLLDLVAPLPPHFSPGRTGLSLGAPTPWYGEPAASLEGFARPLWGLIPFALGGGQFALWREWRTGLVNGTDPSQREFWGWPGDRDQRHVELPAIALGAALVPGELWTPLTAIQRERVAAWFSRINAVEMVDNNWRFFRVLANLALRRLGCDWSRERLDADLRRLDEFYLDHGWYADGTERCGDYYVPMAFHTYSLIFVRLAETSEAAWVMKFRDRARQFAADFQHWFAADGEAIPFGRSLTYRFAQGSFWGALAFADEEALPWGVIKGLYLRHLRWWMRQPIFSETGVLSVGYRYPNLLIGENYNGAGSPYWAFKAFLPLALHDDHPFWQATEAPPPVSLSPVSLPAAGVIVSSDPKGRFVVALNAGQPVVHYPRHAAAKYSKCAYATHFGFGVPSGDTGTLAGGGFDSVLALSDDGVRFRARDTCRQSHVAANVAYSRWQPWPDVDVQTWLVAAGTLHVRVHRIRAGRKLWSSDAGFALGFGSPAEVTTSSDASAAIVVQTLKGASAVRDLRESRTAASVLLEPNSHLSYPLTTMPFLRGEHPAGKTILASVIGATLEGRSAIAEDLSAFSAVVASHGIEIFHHGASLFIQK